MKKNSAIETVFNHATFEKDVSLIINCEVQPNNTTIISSLVKSKILRSKTSFAWIYLLWLVFVVDSFRINSVWLLCVIKTYHAIDYFFSSKGMTSTNIRFHWLILLLFWLHNTTFVCGTSCSFCWNSLLKIACSKQVFENFKSSPVCEFEFQLNHSIIWCQRKVAQVSF